MEKITVEGFEFFSGKNAEMDFQQWATYCTLLDFRVTHVFRDEKTGNISAWYTYSVF